MEIVAKRDLDPLNAGAAELGVDEVGEVALPELQRSLKTNIINRTLKSIKYKQKSKNNVKGEQIRPRICRLRR